MIKKLRRRIISETKQIAVLVDSAAPQSDLFCELCGETSAMISPLSAANLSGISTREIYGLIETGEIHFVETADRQMFVCAVSLKNQT